jgi:hypothetical protein
LALQHKFAAQITIIICYLLLNIIGWITGDLLFSLNIILSSVFFYLITILVISTVFIYPKKKRKGSYIHLYTRRKIADVLLITATSFYYLLVKFIKPVPIPESTNTVLGISVIKTNASKTVHIENTLSRKKGYQGFKKDYKRKLNLIVRAVRKKIQRFIACKKSHFNIFTSCCCNLFDIPDRRSRV